MKRIMLALSLAVLGMQGAAWAAQPDAAAGKILYEKSCVTCHAKMFHGDAAYMFTRPNRKVHNLQELQAQVRNCSVGNDTGWFPEDEADVSAYLNRKYYKFK